MNFNDPINVLIFSIYESVGVFLLHGPYLIFPYIIVFGVYGEGTYMVLTLLTPGVFHQVFPP